MKTPNIFDFAKSEGSQDAVLAYMLQWASPAYGHARKGRVMHDLGTKFLRALLMSTETKQGAQKWARCNFNEVSVETQKKITAPAKNRKRAGHVDVQVEVDGKICLVIEDKTNTSRHEGQIVGYADHAETNCASTRPIYLKTGNESAFTLDETKRICRKKHGGYFGREQLLKVWRSHPNTRNKFIEDFFWHLQDWENGTESFRDTPVHQEWDWRAHEGYYLELEKRLGRKDDEGWNYQSSPAGECICYWWNYCYDQEEKCTLYLQIDHSKYLYVRVCGDDINKDLRRRMYEKVALACNAHFPEISVKKEQGSAKGQTSKIAKILFDDREDDDNPYMVLKKRGKGKGTVDLDKTVKRLKRAAQLVTAS